MHSETKFYLGNSVYAWKALEAYVRTMQDEDRRERETITMSIYDRDRVIADLRAAADFLERRPDIPAPNPFEINVFVTGGQLRDIARIGSWAKRMMSSCFYLHKAFGGVSLDVICSREEVCRRIVTGTRTIPAQTEREEEIVEWICDEALLKKGS